MGHHRCGCRTIGDKKASGDRETVDKQSKALYHGTVVQYMSITPSHPDMRIPSLLRDRAPQNHAPTSA